MENIENEGRENIQFKQLYSNNNNNRKQNNRNATNSNNLKNNQSLIVKDYNTPNVKSEISLIELEMRKTLAIKTNKKSMNIENIKKLNTKRSVVNNLRVIKENPSANKNSNNNLNRNNLDLNRNNLEPIQLNLNNNAYNNNKKDKLLGKQPLSNTQEKNQKVGEDIDISEQNKHNLRPIEVKDYRKNMSNNNGTNSNFYPNQNSQNKNQNSNSNFYPKNNQGNNINGNNINSNYSNNLSVVKPKAQRTVINNRSHKNLFNNTKEENFQDEFSEPKNYNNKRNNNIFDNRNGDINTNLDFYKELLWLLGLGMVHNLDEFAV